MGNDLRNYLIELWLPQSQLPYDNQAPSRLETQEGCGDAAVSNQKVFCWQNYVFKRDSLFHQMSGLIP